jgi:5-methylcytosine-specific restriction enzyme subunit McrC
LDIVGQFSKGTHLNDQLRRVQISFPEVKQIKPNAQTLTALKVNRKTAPYERALELSKFIILNYSPDINHGQQKMIALLFDMNVLWEEYVLKQLKKYTRDNPLLGFEVNGQESKVFYGSGRTIRPDIVLRKGDETIVIDTKWKRPYDASASIEDLRQMYTYGRFWNATKLILLYPGDFEKGNYKPYPNPNDPEMKHECKTSFVSVLDGDNSLDTGIGEKVIGLM